MTKDDEVRNRIRLSVAAYAYEYLSESLMSDEEFDKLSLKIQPEKKTGRVKLDNFFKKHFEPSTGMWIRKHPEKHKLKSLYEAYYSNNM
jgi:hypothetical protein